MMSCLDRRAILPMLLGAAALVPIPLDGQITYLAVVSDGAAHLFRAAYRNGHLTTIDTSPSGLRRGALLQGLSVRGQLVRVRIDSINPDYEPLPPTSPTGFYCPQCGTPHPSSFGVCLACGYGSSTGQS